MRLPRLAILAVLTALPLAGCDVGDEDASPQLGARGDEENAAEKLGFPASATRNTTRVGGGDAVADTAGVVAAVYPASGDSDRPPAVAFVDRADWQAGIAAAALQAPPVGVPALLTDGGEVPEVTADVLARLDPQGSDLSRDAQVIRIGEKPPAPAGRKTAVIRGKDPYELAAAIDRYSTVARGAPSDHVVIASGERPEFAMPAAPWAARSGDSVLFVQRDRVPAATLTALRRRKKTDLYLLGPESVVSERTAKALGRFGRVRRIEGATPVQNAVAFARYERSGFGWGYTVPGYNFTLASTSRPADAVAAAPLGANGVFAPLLLTDDPQRLPRSVESYLLDVQPGFERDDPSSAVYNRVWILGDDKAISVAAQARADAVTTLVPVRTRQP
ncbi:MAG TPA: cell wall-binding repeat-containing protein [Thermoleophilaceae bacterium]|nr:cell wall-binding repeat-containing protein [Thermoleophilaceae bacterium]